MGQDDKDPTLQVATPKGQLDSEQPTELTTSDFESIKPLEPVEQDRGGRGGSGDATIAAWLLLLLIVTAAVVFVVKFWMPQQEKYEHLMTRLDELRSENRDLRARISNDREMLEIAQAEIEGLREQLGPDESGQVATADTPTNSASEGSVEKKPDLPVKVSSFRFIGEFGTRIQEVQALLQEKEQVLAGCAKSLPGSESGASARVMLTLRISTKGEVRDLETKWFEKPEPTFERCLSGVLRKLTLKPMASTSRVTWTMTFGT